MLTCQRLVMIFNLPFVESFAVTSLVMITWVIVAELLCRGFSQIQRITLWATTSLLKDFYWNLAIFNDLSIYFRTLNMLMVDSKIYKLFWRHLWRIEFSFYCWNTLIFSQLIILSYILNHWNVKVVQNSNTIQQNSLFY